MTHGFSFTTPLLLAVAVIAALIDVRSRRIPNWLSLSACLAGLIVHVADGRSSLVDALLGCGLALLIYVPLFALQRSARETSNSWLPSGPFWGRLHGSGFSPRLAWSGASLPLSPLSAARVYERPSGARFIYSNV